MDGSEALAPLRVTTAEQLEQSLAAYNRAARGETTDAFGKSAAMLASLEQGPWYALDLSACSPVRPSPSAGSRSANEWSVAEPLGRAYFRPVQRRLRLFRASGRQPYGGPRSCCTTFPRRTIMNRVNGKVCIVTGAASGVGREDALLLAREGAKVVLTDLNDEAGRQVAAEIGENALFIRQDIANEADWQNVIKVTLERFGRLDVLVNNAAILALGSIEDTSLELWQKVQKINTEGYFLGCKYAVQAMKESGGGSIVNMSSVAALGGMPMFCAYSASKGAVAAMTRSVALHCKQQGYRIRCNSVHPDGINTPMTQPLTGFQAIPQETLDQDPMNRMCAPRDIANVVLFLASDESRFVNGAEIRVDNAQLISGL